MKIGIIGTGNMGYAMLKQAAKQLGDMLLYTDIDTERLEMIQKEVGLPYTLSNEELVNASDVVVVAIKPQYLSKVLMPLTFSKEHIVISIAPGVTLEQLSAYISGSPRIVRAMPNTPAMVGAGMSAIAYDEHPYTEDEKQAIRGFFKSFGEYIECEEHMLDVVVPVSGSSPAYVYMFIEAMADGGVLNGMPRDMAYKMAAQSVMGAARMVLESGHHPGQLKDAVCSPGGTTIEAVRVLEQKGLRSAVVEAMDACYNKTKGFK